MTLCAPFDGGFKSFDACGVKSCPILLGEYEKHIDSSVRESLSVCEGVGVYV